MDDDQQEPEPQFEFGPPPSEEDFRAAAERRGQDDLDRRKQLQDWFRLRLDLVRAMDEFERAWPPPQKWEYGRRDVRALEAREFYASQRATWEIRLHNLIRLALQFPEGNGPDADDVERIVHGDDVEVTEEAVLMTAVPSYRQAIDDFIADCTAVGDAAALAMFQLLDGDEGQDA